MVEFSWSQFRFYKFMNERVFVFLSFALCLRICLHFRFWYLLFSFIYLFPIFPGFRLKERENPCGDIWEIWIVFGATYPPRLVGMMSGTGSWGKTFSMVVSLWLPASHGLLVKVLILVLWMSMILLFLSCQRQIGRLWKNSVFGVYIPIVTYCLYDP